MKQSILLFFSFFSAAQMLAQITIERADYTLTANGAVVSGRSMATTGLSAPEEGANVTWDFSAQALTTPFTYSKEPVSGDPDFPEANLLEYSSDVLLGLVDIPIVFFERIDDDGFATLGRFSSSVNLPAATITGGATDTIKYLGGASVYESPNYFAKFPLNYQDSWQNEFTISLDYLMKVTAFGLDDAPANQTAYFSYNNSVVGYGTLILPNPDGSGSVSMEALLFRRDRVKVDSFFLAGQPAPAIMLAALGLQQGTVSARSEYSFFARGLPRTAMRMTVQNGGVTGANISDDVKDLVSSSRFVAPELAAVTVFPNPTNGEFQVEYEKTDARNWRLQVLNSLGQQVFSTDLTGQPGQHLIDVSLPVNTPAGLYQVILLDSRHEAVSTGRVLKK